MNHLDICFPVTITHERYNAIQDFKELFHLCTQIADKVCFENPTSQISKWFKIPNQYIEPYEHGEPYSKKTGLWLHNLKHIKPTNPVTPKYSYAHIKRNKTTREETLPGIAKGIAKNWG